MKPFHLSKSYFAVWAIVFTAFLLGACTASAQPLTVSKSEAPVVSSDITSCDASAPEDDFRLCDDDALLDDERRVLESISDAPVPFSAGGTKAPAGGSAAGGNYAGTISIKTAAAPDTVSFKKGGSVIDISNSSEGYFMASHKGSSKRLKLQVKHGEMVYNYDLNNTGAFEIFPLQMGNGAYTARVMENVSGSSYREITRYDFSVTLASPNTPFLYPNQYVNYNASSVAVKKSFDLCVNAKTDIEKLKVIYQFMIETIKYDYDKAATVKSGYLPNVDTILASKKGICFDYSSLMAAMLRAQGVPTKLVVGSADAVAATHAWNEVYLQGTGWITIKIENTKTGWKLMDPTFGATGGTSSTYTTARVY